MSEDMKVASSGRPYPSRSAAEKEIDAKGLSETHESVEVNGGWAIRERSDELPLSVQNGEKFFRVRFAAKSSRNDTDKVMISVNGDTLTIRRGDEVVIPERFVNAARDAVTEHFVTKPDGSDRKTRSSVITYPFTVVGPGTEAEYRQLRDVGTAEVRKTL